MRLPTTKETLEQLTRHRRFQQRMRGATNRASAVPRQYEIFSCGGPGSCYSTSTTMKFAVKQAEAEAWQNPGSVMSVWSPLRGHVYQAVVDGGQYKVLHGDVVRSARFDTPEQLVDELIRFIETTPALKELRLQAEQNQADLMANGVYDGQVAFRAFIPVADDAIHQYKEQFGTAQQEQFPHDIRQMMAEKMVRLFEQQRREDPERFVEEYVEPKLEQPAGQQQHVIQTDGDDGKTIIINIGEAKHD